MSTNSPVSILKQGSNCNCIEELTQDLDQDLKQVFEVPQQDWTDEDRYYMQLALSLAEQGAHFGEVPVGAVLVQHQSIPDCQRIHLKEIVSKEVKTSTKNIFGLAKADDIDHQLVKEIKGEVIGQGYNRPIIDNDPTAHAEVIALRCACEHLSNYRLPPNTTLYVTLEPCTMCVGALIHARLSRLVFAANEPKAGMVGSKKNLLVADCYNHTIEVQSGLLATESRAVLQNFFKERRAKKKAERKAKQALMENKLS